MKTHLHWLVYGGTTWFDDLVQISLISDSEDEALSRAEALVPGKQVYRVVRVDEGMEAHD